MRTAVAITCLILACSIEPAADAPLWPYLIFGAVMAIGLWWGAKEA